MGKSTNDLIIDCPAYKESSLVEYNGNPFIEALPKIWTNEEVARMFNFKPPYDGADILEEPNVRLHMIKRLLSFKQMLDKHYEINYKISSMLRDGYKHRNPM